MLLVTGGTGFIGSHTVRAALARDGGCVAATRTTRPLPELLAGGSMAAGLSVEAVDVRDTDALVDLGRRHEVTGIVHLAAAAIDDPPLEQLRHNLDGFLAVIEAAKILGVARVTFASSIGVYAGLADASSPLREDTPLPPVGLHGIQASKKVLEVAGDLASRTGDVEVIAVRIPAVWGPGGNPSSRFFELPQLVHAAVRGEVLPEVAGIVSIESVYVRDAGRALVAVQASDRLHHRTYNLGSGAPTNAEVVEAVRAAVPDAAYRVAGALPAERFELDTSRIREDTEWAPEYDLASGIADYVAWLRGGHQR